jgi:hypothetical protein
MKRIGTILLTIGLTMTATMPLIAQNNAEAGLDNIFRTSDEDTETATQASRRKGQRTQALPEGSERIGCVCMSGNVRSTTGIGSCSGQGGVRYWLVENAEGDTLQYPTSRQALNSDTEVAPYVGPSPQSRAANAPTIIFMPPQTNGFTEMPDGGTPPDYVGTSPYKRLLDSQIVIFQTPTRPYDTIARNQNSDVLFGLPLIFNSMIQLCMVLIVCGTLVVIVKLFLNQGQPDAGNSIKVFKNIRLTLLKILVRGNRFFK